MNRHRMLSRPGFLRTAVTQTPAMGLGLIALLALTGLVLAGAASLAHAQAKPAANPPQTSAAPTPAPADTTVLDRRVIVYYFHGNQRCASCRQIEAYSHTAIEAAYAKELASGRLVWRLVNVDEKANEHFVKDFELFTKSLVLVDESNGKQLRWKNLAKVWELLPYKERFFDYVQTEVRGYLTEVQ
jgi:hypothetical protein